jgi:histone deacetylase 6
MEAQLQELMFFLWDNYIQLSESADEIFLMGVGNASLGIKALLTGRGMRETPPSLAAPV